MGVGVSGIVANARAATICEVAVIAGRRLPVLLWWAFLAVGVVVQLLTQKVAEVGLHMKRTQHAEMLSTTTAGKRGVQRLGLHATRSPSAR